MPDKISIDKVIFAHSQGFGVLTFEEARAALKEILESVIDRCADKVEVKYLKKNILSIKDQIEY